MAMNVVKSMVLTMYDETFIVMFSRIQVQKEKDGILIIGYNFSSCVSHFYTSQEIRNLPIKIIGTVTEIRRKLK
jgi:hypothetical protein